MFRRFSELGHRPVRLCLFIASIAPLACGAPDEEDPPTVAPPAIEGPEAAEMDDRPNEADEKLLDGVLTQDRPEVGRLSVGCTGTLVSPDVVITAAHCVGYGSATGAGRRGTFTVEAADGSEHDFTIARYRSYSGQLGANDICLMQLAASVPESVARPAPIAAVAPPNGGSLTVFGYGCTSRGTRTDWRKRKATFAQGDDTAHLCPGDSGGPVFDDALGAVLRINSGYYLGGRGSDIFGFVPGLHDDLRAQIAEWTRDGGIPEPGDPDGPPGPRDEVAPVITEVTPEAGAIVAPRSRARIEARVQDEVGLARVSLEWAFNGKSYPCPTNQENVTCTVEGDRYVWSVYVVNEAERPFEIKAADRAGNTATSERRSLRVQAVRDVEAPSVEILAPTPADTWPANSTVTVAALVRDDVGLSKTELVWDFNRNRYACPSTSQYVSCVVEGDVRTWSVRVGSGERRFRIEATDAAGNVGRSRDLVVPLQ
jgi:hypothetical protein